MYEIVFKLSWKKIQLDNQTCSGIEFQRVGTTTEKNKNAGMNVKLGNRQQVKR